MAIGGFILGLGFALIFGSINIANLAYAVSAGGSSDVISISYYFVWTGVVLFPIGLAILAYGVGARESSSQTISTETGI
jgi:hypothetical protein